MKREEFEARCLELQTYAENNPQGYRNALLGMVALGFGYVVGLLVISLLLSIGCIVLLVMAAMDHISAGGLLLKLCIALLIFTFILAKSLWVRMRPPEGVVLTRGQAPAFFAMLDELRNRLQALPIHRVIVVDDYNAFVAQIPRLGIFGWHRNWLAIGLPLMQSLDPQEFRSVIAHELGHLSRNHSRFSGWIYRVFGVWDRLAESLQQQGSIVLGKFANWYLPRLNAWSFVLRRQDEYEADRCAAELTTPAVAGRALVAVNSGGSFLASEFMPSLFKQAIHEPSPPREVRAARGGAVREHPSHQKVGEWVQQSLNLLTDFTDSHPCLRDRLSGLGLGDMATVADLENAGLMRTVPQRSAADEYLGPLAEGLDKAFAGEWLNIVSEPWKRHYEEAQQKRKRLQELNQKVEAAPLGEDEDFERADLIEDLNGEEEGLAAFRSMLERHPAHALSAFCVGRLLLHKGDEAGLEWIDRAMKSEPRIVAGGCNIVYGFLSARGRHAEARQYVSRYDQHSKEIDKAEAERANVTKKDKFVPHTIDAQALGAVVAVLDAIPEVRRAWLVRREVTHMAQIESHVLAAEFSYGALRLGSGELFQKSLNKIAEKVEFPTEVRFICVNHEMKGYIKIFDAIPGSKIYQRPKK